MKTSRRQFLISCTAAIGCGALRGHKAFAASLSAGSRPSRLNLGFMVWRIGDILDFDAQVDWVAQAGFESISFHASAGIPGKWRGIDPAVASPAERQRIRKRLSGFRMREIHAPFDAKLQSETPPAVVKRLESVLEFAGDVGSSVVTVHADPPPLDAKHEPGAWNRTLDRLDAAAAKADTRVGIEFNTGFEWLRRPRRGHIGATLDVGHMYFGNGQGYRPYGSIGGQIRSLKDVLIHLHVHDFKRGVDHIEIGTGEVDFDDILRSLRQIDYQGALCLELNPDRVTPDGIRRSAEYLRKMSSRG